MLNLTLQTIMLFLLVVTGYAALNARDLLSAVVIFSVFSFFAVILYLVLNSPDVAFIEAVIGIIATLFFVIALRRLDRWCSE